jgi:hypothetical protein
MRQRRLSDRIHVKSQLIEFLMIHHISAVENKGRFGHGAIDSFIIQIPELTPFRHDGHGMASGCRFVGIFDELNFPFYPLKIGLGIGQALGIGSCLSDLVEF